MPARSVRLSERFDLSDDGSGETSTYDLMLKFVRLGRSRTLRGDNSIPPVPSRRGPTDAAQATWDRMLEVHARSVAMRSPWSVCNCTRRRSSPRLCNSRANSIPKGKAGFSLHSPGIWHLTQPADRGMVRETRRRYCGRSYRKVRASFQVAHGTPAALDRVAACRPCTSCDLHRLHSVHERGSKSRAPDDLEPR